MHSRRARCIGKLEDRLLLGQSGRIGINPGFQRETVRGEARQGRRHQVFARPIEVERLPHQPLGKAQPVHQFPIVSTHHVCAIAFTGPPGHLIRRRGAVGSEGIQFYDAWAVIAPTCIKLNKLSAKFLCSDGRTSTLMRSRVSLSRKP